MSTIAQDAPGKIVLLMGNEAIARGALEAGVKVCAAYPGNPSSEIVGSLSRVANEAGIHVEWSVNEKVALEVATAASFAGLRGLCSMKQNGLNVASDFLLNLNLTGCEGGLVVVVADDPGALSSSNEEDSRGFARLGDRPIHPLDVTSGDVTYPEVSEVVNKIQELSRRVWTLNATEIALEMGDPIFSNMVMLGALSSIEVIPIDRLAFEATIEELLPPAKLAENMESFDKGRAVLKRH